MDKFRQWLFKLTEQLDVRPEHKHIEGTITIDRHEDRVNISKEKILNLADRPEGFQVHIYAWSHNKLLKRCNRYAREGLLQRKRRGEYYIYWLIV